MSFKTFVVFAATALLVQTAYSQQCGCGYSNQGISPISNGIGYGSGISSGNLGYGSGVNTGCGGSVSYGTNSGINVGSSNLGSIYPQGLEALAIAVGSTYAPSGISVLADNLEIGGNLIVSGQLPVIGCVSVSGDVPTGGQGQVQYSTASNVGLTSGGCGYGLATNVPNVGYGNSGIVGNSVYGIVGNSGLELVGRGGYNGCGCGL